MNNHIPCAACIFLSFLAIQYQCIENLAIARDPSSIMYLPVVEGYLAPGYAYPVPVPPAGTPGYALYIVYQHTKHFCSYPNLSSFISVLHVSTHLAHTFSGCGVQLTTTLLSRISADTRGYNLVVPTAVSRPRRGAGQSPCPLP